MKERLPLCLLLGLCFVILSCDYWKHVRSECVIQMVRTWSNEDVDGSRDEDDDDEDHALECSSRANPNESAKS